jgi:hypothetical protein
MLNVILRCNKRIISDYAYFILHFVTKQGVFWRILVTEQGVFESLGFDAWGLKFVI